MALTSRITHRHPRPRRWKMERFFCDDVFYRHATTEFMNPPQNQSKLANPKSKIRNWQGEVVGSSYSSSFRVPRSRNPRFNIFVFFAISAVKSSSWVEKGAFEGQTLPCRLCESSFMPAASFYQRLVYGSMPMNHRVLRSAFS